MPTERELKFTVQDPDALTADALAAAFEGTDLHLEAAQTIRHADRYYDDPRLSLSRAGVALRRRIGGGRIVATLKTRGRIQGALHEREEIELPLEGRDWPGVIHDRVARITEPGALKGRYELETERTRFIVRATAGEDAGEESERRQLAEISIDRVEATRATGGRAVTFAELEIEDLGGGVETLDRVAERIRRVTDLRPSTETKLERARRLLLSDAPAG